MTPPSPYPERLQKVRKWLTLEGFQVLLIPQGDEYLNKITSPYAKRLKWLCGFDGSAGLLVITSHQAALFTDSRYSVQARQELDASLFEVFDTNQETVSRWLISKVSPKSRVAYDPWLYTVDVLQRQEAVLQPHDLSLVPVTPNPIDTVWEDQPSRPKNDIFVHPLCYAGEDALSKQRRIAGQLPPQSFLFIGGGDSLCWLLNVRGQDIPQTPVFQGYGLLEASSKMHVFVDPQKVTPEVDQALGSLVKVWDIGQFSDIFSSLVRGKKVFFDPLETPSAVCHLLRSSQAQGASQRNLCLLAKALKNETELTHIRQDHITDGVALVRCLYWLETQAPLEKNIGEWDVAQQLAIFKRECSRYWSESFDPIVGYGVNSALIHYRPDATSQACLDHASLLLMDTGSQYRSGTTTDVTRTITLGKPSAQEKHLFTRVLKGHIQLASAIFPEGTKGCHLDVLARLALWEVGLNYPHSTGHGVGSFLNVHEGPHGISSHSDGVALAPSMLVTIEPGYYRPGHFGIRLENMVEIVEKERGENGVRFFGFEPLTCVPFDMSLLEHSLLTTAEKRWLDMYHISIYEKLSPFLESSVQKWLRDKTRPCEERA